MKKKYIKLRFEPFFVNPLDFRFLTSVVFETIPHRLRLTSLSKNHILF